MRYQCYRGSDLNALLLRRQPEDRSTIRWSVALLNRPNSQPILSTAASRSF